MTYRFKRRTKYMPAVLLACVVASPLMALSQSLAYPLKTNGAESFELRLAQQSPSVGFPGDLQVLLNTAEFVAAGYKRGEFPEAYYRDRMNTLRRMALAKYPGYRHQIDKIFNDLTSVQPGKNLRNNTSPYADKPDNKDRDDFIKHIISQTEVPNALPADFFERERSGNPYSLTDLRDHFYRQSSNVAALKEENKRLRRKLQTNNLDHNEALRVARARTNDIIQNILDDTTTKLGLNWNQIANMADDWAKIAATGGKVDQKIKQRINVELTLSFLRGSALIEQELEGDFSRDGNPKGRLADWLKADEVKDLRTSALRPIQDLADAIQKNDYTMMKVVANRLAEF